MYFVSVIRKGETEISDIPFECIEEGDTFFAKGERYVCGEDAHYSGDSSYDGYLLYDTDENSWFPEDLDVDVGKYYAER